MRPIKFVVNDKEYGFCSIETVDKPLGGRGAHNFKGFEIAGGYILRKVSGHPNANGRGYYLEHRLVIEESLKRLLAKDEIVHHIDGNRKNNELSNLKVITQSEHAGIEHVGKRNPNGTLVASEPIFEQIIFRLHDTDRGLTQIYTLSKLIGTTFRKGKFQFRGRWTGLLDKNGKEIYEGDIVHYKAKGWDWNMEVMFDDGGFCVKNAGIKYELFEHGIASSEIFEVIGNIYENPELIKNNA